jgi:hypothetical protein
VKGQSIFKINHAKKFEILLLELKHPALVSLFREGGKTSD